MPSHIDKEESLITWLLNSGVQESCLDHPAYGGIHSGYDTHKNTWLFYYSEITGYAISLYSMLYKKYGTERFLDLANRSAFFLQKHQVKTKGSSIEGAFPEGLEVSDLSVMPRHYTFDAAMCIQGLLDLYSLTKDDSLLNSAISGGNWLLSMQNSSGSFLSYFNKDSSKKEHPGPNFHLDSGCLHAKHAIALLKLFNVTQDKNFKISAQKVCDWVLGLQDEDGAFWVNESRSYVYSHAHCYATEGLLFAFDQMKTPSYGIAINKATTWLQDNILTKYGGLIGSHKIDKEFHPIEQYSSRSYFRIFRRLFPRKEIATDASVQSARIFLYSFYQSNDNQDLENAETIIRTLIPLVTRHPLDRQGLYSRLDISLGWSRRTQIVATWPILFALQACILNNESLSKERKVISIAHLF